MFVYVPVCVLVLGCQITDQSLTFNQSTLAEVKITQHTPHPRKTQRELLVVFRSDAPVQNGFLSHSTAFLEVGIDL